MVAPKKMLETPLTGKDLGNFTMGLQVLSTFQAVSSITTSKSGGGSSGGGGGSSSSSI